MHEAYYEDGSETPYAISEYSQGIIEETPEELKWALEKMIEATKKPILNYEDF